MNKEKSNFNNNLEEIQNLMLYYFRYTYTNKSEKLNASLSTNISKMLSCGVVYITAGNMFRHYEYRSTFDLRSHHLLLVLHFFGIQHVGKPLLFQHCTLRSYKTNYIRNFTSVR